MKFSIRTRYIVELEAQLEANDLHDALDQVAGAGVADLVTPHDGVILKHSDRIAIRIEPLHSDAETEPA